MFAVSDRAKNLLSVQHTSQILCDNNRLSNQLLLSSEIDPFEGCHTKNPQNILKYIEILGKPMILYTILQGKPMVFDDFCKENQWFYMFFVRPPSNGLISELKRSWLDKRLLPHSISSMCCTLSRL